ncbi:unnamed protein product [Clonostachys rosea f. rosea IK726]|uniref:Uncharacterized protein n=1 Tax=Clonostachys rosea f. rosea IK726 TaxID=1349383 RepID=A0ACA9T9C4_BIOOC|nr:unnamed protein product [Clonostachys rosea f. rosea IK726]
MVDEDPVWQNIQRIQTERRGLRRFKFPGSTADCLHKTHHQDKRRRISCDKTRESDTHRFIQARSILGPI